MNVHQLEQQLGQHGELLDDPLAIHEQLVAVYSQDFGKEKQLLAALERCTRALVDDKRYTNDVRYFRIWMQYAKLCKDPAGIFEFLYRRHLFRDVAAFYEEWARLSSANVDFGRQILQKGIQNGAQPLERLRKTLAAYGHDAKNVQPDKRASWENGTTLPFFHDGSHNNTQTSLSVKKAPMPATETPFYDASVIDHGRLSFEQARALYYREQVAKSPSHFPAIEEDEEEDVPGLSQPINPDDLTHISVFKDGTTGDLSRLVQLANSNEALVEQAIAERISGTNIASLAQKILPRLAQSLSVNGATAPAIKTPIGQFFVERRVCESMYEGIDVEQDVPQKVVLNVDTHPWPRSGFEAATLLAEYPLLFRACRCEDAVVLVHPVCPSLVDALQGGHPALALYFALDLMRQLQGWHARSRYHGNLTVERALVHFALPRCTLLLLGCRAWDTTARGMQADMNAVESIVSMLSERFRDPAVWAPLLQGLQRKLSLSELVQAAEDALQSYRGTPTLKSLLNRLEMSILSS